MDSRATQEPAVPRPIWPDGELALDAPEGCRLWLLDLLHPLAAAQWAACAAEEHEKAARFRFEKDALRYRAAHAGMRRVLARELGIAPREVRWRTGTQGKPHLACHEGWHFNLSHSGDWALLGLSDEGPIGVDIECHRPSTDIDLLAEHQFTTDEQAAFRQCPPSAREAFFFQTWVCKEAILKALGCGLLVEPGHVTAHPGGWARHWVAAHARTQAASFALEVHGLALPPEAGLAQASVARVPMPMRPALAATGW